MAALRAPSTSFLSAFLPIARATLYPDLAPITRRIPLLTHLRTSLIPAAFLPIPALLGDLWDGILNAVPKKKTSHMKKRHRFMAGKGLKDVTALNKCSIRRWFATGFKSKDQLDLEKDELYGKYNEEQRIKGKRVTDRLEEEEESEVARARAREKSQTK
ncbi:hypothetical protein LTR97_004471 [Elasticomyces elasticus]|uniref:Uncharacterized protein n=1 Tax=Elasticomyces elasticus TaxID=574655 RepID=A0AAN7ZUF5_9PEZI|nr:hypothetical protein LTR97_004471 [Elasticomyces elasticus]